MPSQGPTEALAQPPDVGQTDSESSPATNPPAPAPAIAKPPASIDLPASNTDQIALERNALVALYDATEGRNWANHDNWLSKLPVGEWYGVTTRSVGVVIELNLQRNRLQGEIPAQLGQLANLAVLGLGDNQLEGEIPAQLGQLANLGGLFLGGNQLEGEIPVQLGQLANLRRLFIENNRLQGEIPTELGRLSKLTDLNIGENQLSGCLPTSWRKEFEGYSPITLGHLPFCSVLGFTSSTDQIALERTALVALYDATDGQNWAYHDNWLSNLPVGEWYGVTTDSVGSVTQLTLQGNRLEGEIPAQLGQLTNLGWLGLYNNQLEGEIPAQLGQLANLGGLVIADNQLEGEIPAQLGQLANLEGLNLGGNQLRGGIPAQLGQLANLEGLFLGGNQLEGEIPAQLGQLANLRRLFIENNRLQGEIPTELGRLSKLTDLNIGENQLSGCLPTSWRKEFEGYSPITLGHLPFCSVLGFTSSTDQIALERTALVALYDATDGQNWAYHDNWLSNLPVGEWYGVTTDSVGSVTQLTLQGNRLEGEIPAQLGQLANLAVLDLQGNQLEGEIPAQLGQLANLRWLDLQGNRLEGEIPAQLGQLANLAVLDLQGNRLEGEIPAQLGQLANLESLNLADNRLEGEIPAQLDMLANLFALGLASNQLEGDIPAELGMLANLGILTLHNNRLQGKIPAELGKLSKLTYLNIEENQLSGEIPPELGNLANLTWLGLLGNELSGCVPSSLLDRLEEEKSGVGGFPFCQSATAAPKPAAAASQMTGRVKASFQKFYVIDVGLDEYGDHDSECKLQLGGEYRLADWNDLTEYYAGGGSIPELISGLNWKDEKTTDVGVRHPKVSKDGNERWGGGRRHYFVSRHDHVPPGYFLVHNHIDNYHLSLGSWYGPGGEALCFRG